MSAKLAYIYLRLSDEEFKQGESSSIQNQRLAIHQYCERNQITVIREFVDDGFSGSNFDRPGFTDMLRHLKRREVSLVLTKDLSRLGRDMRESSYYAETFFPENGIHYIAIHDNFDSEKDNTLAPFQFAMNDVYLRDTSKKVRNILDTKKKAGEYAACSPYGYKKNPRDKSKLIPDERTAPVVEMIFRLASEGLSTRAICDQLNSQHVIPPLKYRVEHTGDFGEKGAARASDQWSYMTVKRILRNEVYLGHTLLGRSKKLSVKAKKKVPLERSEWHITRNTHQPLVTQEMFDAVQRNLQASTKAWQQYDHVRRSVFGGIAFCAHCGAALCSAGTVYNGEREKYWYLQCNNLPKRSRKPCEHPARIKYSDFVEIITRELNYFISLTDEQMEEVVQQVQEGMQNGNREEEAQKAIKTLERRQSQIDDLITKLYMDHMNGKLEEERLDRMVQSLQGEAKSNKEKIQKLKDSISQLDQMTNNYLKFFALVKQATHIDVLTHEIVRTFIDRIEVGERILPQGITIAGPKTPYKQEIKIFYRFIGDISQQSMQEVERK